MFSTCLMSQFPILKVHGRSQETTSCPLEDAEAGKTSTRRPACLGQFRKFHWKSCGYRGMTGFSAWLVGKNDPILGKIWLIMKYTMMMNMIKLIWLIWLIWKNDPILNNDEYMVQAPKIGTHLTHHGSLQKLQVGMRMIQRLRQSLQLVSKP